MNTESGFEQLTPSNAMNKKLKELSMCCSEDHQESIYKALENSYFDDSHEIIAIVYNKQKMLERNPANVNRKVRTVKRASFQG